LGLAFCKLAVEAHGGTIGVEDATPRGSIFAFEIPA
jgi:signal transduction histidine kinase